MKTIHDITSGTHDCVMPGDNVTIYVVTGGNDFVVSLDDYKETIKPIKKPLHQLKRPYYRQQQKW